MGQARYLELDRSTQLPLASWNVKNKKLDHRVIESGFLFDAREHAPPPITQHTASITVQRGVLYTLWDTLDGRTPFVKGG